MYHPHSTEHARRSQRSWVRIIIALVAALLLSGLFFASAREAMREQGASSLRMAILESAKQCCAVEGAYPRSLDYLVDHYGLVVNDRDYRISYESYADNVVPSVVVTPL